jgi:hypothetical protein
LLPSVRVTVPTSEGLMPFSCGVPVPAGTGGHRAAHSPSQVDFDGLAVSLSNTYNVRPLLSTTTLPKLPTSAVASFGAAVVLWLELLCGAAAGVVSPLPQAVRVARPRTAVAATKAKRFMVAAPREGVGFDTFHTDTSRRRFSRYVGVIVT